MNNNKKIKVEEKIINDIYDENEVWVENTTSMCYKCDKKGKSIDAKIIKKGDVLFIRKYCSKCGEYVEKLEQILNTVNNDFILKSEEQIADNDTLKDEVLIENTTSMCYKCSKKGKSINAQIIQKGELLFIRKCCSRCGEYTEKSEQELPIVKNERKIVKKQKVSLIIKIIHFFLFGISGTMIVAGFIGMPLGLLFLVMGSAGAFMLYFIGGGLLFGTGLGLFNLLNLKDK